MFGINSPFAKTLHSVHGVKLSLKFMDHISSTLACFFFQTTDLKPAKKFFKSRNLPSAPPSFATPSSEKKNKSVANRVDVAVRVRPPINKEEREDPEEVVEVNEGNNEVFLRERNLQ